MMSIAETTKSRDRAARGALIVLLSEPEARAPDAAGGKASSLAALLAAGFPVPPGFVVTIAATSAIVAGAGLGVDADAEAMASASVPAAIAAEIVEAFEGLGGPVAVRSSAVAEDTATASYAGMYETVLDVRDGQGVLAAIMRCIASARAARVRAYRGVGVAAADAGIAVLVQRMVEADAAGVAFTADPVTGDRSTVVVSAVGGLGERLVSGLASAEEWRERSGELVRLRSADVLDEAGARAVVDLAQRVARDAGAPRDVEWATAKGETFLLQARPITALPDEIRWDAPPGGWLRNFRIGEWLGDPVSPSFASWGLARIESGMHRYIAEVCGFTLPEPAHVIVNGWYFYGGLNLGSVWRFVFAIPRMLSMFVLRFREFAALTPPIAHLGFDFATERWRTQLVPPYRALAAEVAEVAQTAPIGALPALVDRVTEAAGQQFGSIIGVAGYAAKAELKLAAFWAKHLADVEGSWLDLVREGDVEGPSAHDVQSLDWLHALPCELGGIDSVAPHAETRARVVASREATLARAKAALRSRGSLVGRFDALVAEARRAHRVREEQSRLLTLPWPSLRAILLRIGVHLVGRGVLAVPEQVFFLTKEEIEGALQRVIDDATLAKVAGTRQQTWQRQRGLSAPLQLGTLPAMHQALFRQVERMVHGDAPPAANELRGMPGSPGSVTAKVRVLRQVEQLDRLLPGEVLVAPVTTPGWTPAFLRAGAVITDSGSIASHASIVAREYGLPAVVATGNATALLRDGDVVTVDGSRGRVLCMSRDLDR